MKLYIKISAMLMAAVAGILLTAATSFAHHLWVVENDDAYAVCRGHVGESMDPYDPACVTEILAFAGG